MLGVVNGGVPGYANSYSRLKGAARMRVRHLSLITLLLAVALIVPARAQQSATAGQKSQGTLRSPDVIFVPTPTEVVDAMLTLANVTQKDLVYDLGCGDGAIVTRAAEKFGARAVGIDIDPQRVKEANERVQKAGVTDKVKIQNGDLFTSDISPATVVTLYLLQSLNIKLIPKLNSELKPGTRVVSQSFSMGDDYPAEKTVDVNGRSVYLWTIPMKQKK
jgi:precorrin-6B methylase 2